MKNPLEKRSVSHIYLQKKVFLVVSGDDFIYHFPVNQFILPTQMGAEPYFLITP